jgi:hypothetical protein
MMSDMAAGDELQEPRSTPRQGTDPGEATTPRGERAQTARGSERLPRYAIEPAPTVENSDDVLELESDDRKTQRVSAEHFRSMRRAVAVRDAVGTIKKPEPVDTLSPPLEHEELASSNLIKEALAQLKAGARLDTDSDRERLDTLETPPLRADSQMEDASIEDEPAGEIAIARITPVKISVKQVADAAVDTTKERGAPNTIPMTNKELADIGALKPRHAIKMAPLTKPPDLRHAPTAKARAATDGEVIELTAKKQAAIEDEVVEPRSDVGLLIVVAVLVLGVIATIAILMAG